MTRPIEVDLLILRALRSGPMHGYGIAQQVRVQSDDILQAGEGSLYPALQRLLLNGRVKAEWGASENNRRARYYTLRPVTPEMDVRVAGAAVSILMWGGYGQERPAAQNGEAPLLRKEAAIRGSNRPRASATVTSEWLSERPWLTKSATCCFPRTVIQTSASCAKTST
jgi:hypothetical protein